MLDPYTERITRQEKVEKLTKQGKESLAASLICLVGIIFVELGATWGISMVAFLFFLNMSVCIWEVSKLKE